MISNSPVPMRLNRTMETTQMRQNIFILLLDLSRARRFTNQNLMRAHIQTRLTSHFRRIHSTRTVSSTNSRQLVPQNNSRTLHHRIMSLIQNQLSRHTLRQTNVNRITIRMSSITLSPRLTRTPTQVTTTPNRRTISLMTLIRRRFNRVDTILTNSAYSRYAFYRYSFAHFSRSSEVTHESYYIIVSNIRPIISTDLT